MEVPAQVTFRGFEPTKGLKAHIQKKAQALEKFCNRITRCRVMVEQSCRRHQTGNLFHLRIDVTLPGTELVVRRDPAEDASHEDLRAAVRDAFDAAARKIENYVKRRFNHRHPPRSHWVEFIQHGEPMGI